MLDPLWGDDFINTYMSLANRTSIDNEMMNALGMFVLVGQTLRNVQVPIGGAIQDLRTHGFMIQDSGSGKGPTFGFIKHLCKLTRFKMVTFTQMSSPGMIGTITSDKAVYGALYDSDILGCKEAKTLLKTAKKEHSNDIIENLNEAMDEDGHITKRLAQGTLEYTTHASLLFTTNPPKMDLEHIGTGFLPRMLVCNRTVDEAHYDKVIAWQNRNIGHRPEDMLENMTRLSQTIDHISKTYGAFEQEPDEFFDFECDFGILANMIDTELKKRSYDVIDKCKVFKTRMNNNGRKLACSIGALNDCSMVITNAHVEKATAYMLLFWNSTLDFAEKIIEYPGDAKMARIENAVRCLCTGEEKSCTVRELLRITKYRLGDVNSYLEALDMMGIIKYDPDVRNPHGQRSRNIKWLDPDERRREQEVHDEPTDEPTEGQGDGQVEP